MDQFRPPTKHPFDARLTNSLQQTEHQQPILLLARRHTVRCPRRPVEGTLLDPRRLLGDCSGEARPTVVVQH